MTTEALNTASSPTASLEKQGKDEGMIFSQKLASSESEEGGMESSPAYASKFSKWWSDEEENAVRRKLDLRIAVISFLLYLVALLDRSNIGNAKTAGMEKDLHMSDSQYQWLLTIFYIVYIVFQFQVFAYKLLPPRVWITWCVFVWGVAGVCQAATTNWAGMMVSRLFLGISEAGYGTGVALYMGFFYPKTEIGLRFGLFVASGALSSAIAGSIAYGLVHAHTSVASWRLLFLIEGVPTLAMVPITFFFMPNSIQSATFLTEREKSIAESRLFRPPPPEAMTGEAPTLKSRLREQVNWANAAAAFKDPMSYVSAVLFFIINVGYSSVPVYLPTLISEMGYGSIRAQGLSAPPYVLAFVLSLLLCWLTDRYQVRGPVCTALLAVGAVGYMMLATLRSTAARYVAVWLVVNGLFPFIPLLYMWLMSNQPGDSRKGLALVIFATVGQCGPLLGTRLFPAKDQPYYVTGTATSGGLLWLGMVVAGCTSVAFWVINRRRDADQGKTNALDMPSSIDANEAKEGAAAIDAEARLTQAEIERRKLDLLLRGDKSPYFRYTI